MVFLHHALPIEASFYAKHTNIETGNVLISIVFSFAFGLCLFFLLSAYLITTLLLIELRKTGKIHIKDFYLRRILRMWPLYALGLTIGFFIAIRQRDSHDVEMFTFYTFFIGNWFFLNHNWSANPMTPLWSISVEEQFYIVLPLFMTLLGRKYLALGALGIIACSMFALYLQGNQHLAIHTAIWVNTLSQSLFLGSGILLAILTNQRTLELNNFISLLAACTASVLFFLAAYIFDGERIGYASSGATVLLGYFLVMLGCTLLLIAIMDIGHQFPKVSYISGKNLFWIVRFSSSDDANHTKTPGLYAFRSSS
jgi:peptidoglycan/LPS O-acetylase OafA/YrhL